MSKFQPATSNDDVCRVPTDKQTHIYTHTQTYILSKNWGNLFFLTDTFFNFYLSFSISIKVKKTVSKILSFKGNLSYAQVWYKKVQ